MQNNRLKYFGDVRGTQKGLNSL